MTKQWMRAIGCALMLWAAGAQAVTLQPFEPDSMERIIAGQQDKSFVLVVWSLDCEYCKASLATLAREKRRRGTLNAVTLCTDPLSDAQGAKLMRKRLKSAGLTANAWAFGTASPEQLRYAIDPKWHGEMPRSYWFNARGESVAYSGVITSATVAKMMGRQ